MKNRPVDTSNPGKHTKIKNIEYKEYKELCIQEYLLEGNMKTDISELIYKMREKPLDIKEYKKWKDLCIVQMLKQKMNVKHVLIFKSAILCMADFRE